MPRSELARPMHNFRGDATPDPNYEFNTAQRNPRDQLVLESILEQLASPRDPGQDVALEELIQLLQQRRLSTGLDTIR